MPFPHFHFHVLEHLPPQQGLRHKPTLATVTLQFVLEHLPPQQGLRQEIVTLPSIPFGSTRTSSTTTRIKTNGSQSRLIVTRVLEHLPPQQGLRPQSRC